MNLGFLALIAVLPILVSILMRYVSRQSRLYSIPLSCLLAVMLSIVIWGTPLEQVTSSLIQGLITSAQLILLMISVIFFMETLRATKTIDSVRVFFENISPDRRVQAILVAWFFGAGIGNLFGFASTGGICAIILYGIGFPPACAVMLSVLGLMVSSTFDCSGAPILFGVAQGLGQPDFLTKLSSAGWDMPTYLHLISAQVGILNGIVGTFSPLLMIIFMQKFFGRRQTWTAGLSFAPFAIFCGLAFTIPYAYAAIYLGPQFPSLVGSFVGMAVALTAVRMKFLLPHESWNFTPHREWPKMWSGGPYKAPGVVPKTSPFFAFMPFVLLGCFAIMIRLPDLRLMKFLQSYMLEHANEYVFLVDPLFLCLSVFLIGMGLFQLFSHEFSVTEETLGQRMRIPIFHALRSLPFIMPMARVYIDSDVNPTHIPGMFRSMAEFLMQFTTAECFAPFFSLLLGAANTNFSVTHIYSNLTLSSFQYNLGQAFGGHGTMFVALQVIGASAGCMFGMHYLIGTSVSINRSEVVGPIGRITMIAMFSHILAVGLLSLIGEKFFHLTQQLSLLYMR